MEQRPVSSVADERAMRRAGELENTVANTATNAPADAPSPCAGPGVAVDDWSLMFDAALNRLRLAFEELVDAVARDVQGDGEVDRLHVVVLDCVQALEQLHGDMTHELRSRQMPGS